MKNTVTTFIDVDLLMAEASKAHGKSPGSGAVIKLVLEWELETFATEQPTISAHASEPGEQTDHDTAEAQEDEAEAPTPRSRGSWHDTIAQFPNP